MPKKILVIDDDRRMLVLEKTILVQGGFAVETASDGVERLEKLQARPYDGIVLDVTPIVMVTASVGRSAMTQGFSSGAVVFMNKPFTAKKFLTLVQTIIR